MQLTENTGCKKNLLKICHLHTIAQLYLAISLLAFKARIGNRKRNLLNSNITLSWRSQIEGGNIKHVVSVCACG